jgi:cell division protein FtsB
MAEMKGGRDRRALWIRRLALSIIPAVAFSGALVALVLDREDGLGTLLELRVQAREARTRVDGLVAERERLSALVRGLRSDPDQIEAVARAQLGMLRPGEVVVRMPAAGEH